MKDLLIIGIPILIIVVLFLLSFEKRLKESKALLIISILTTIFFSGYLLGTMVTFSLVTTLLIVIFVLGGLWRLKQYTRLVEMKKRSDDE